MAGYSPIRAAAFSATSNSRRMYRGKIGRLLCLGDEGVGLTGYFASATPAVYVMCRRGSYVVLLCAKDTTGALSSDCALRLGKVIDARIYAG